MSSVPKITIIAIWNPRETPALYLPEFFASVKANPLINLLFIVVDKQNVGRCHEPIPNGAPNIKEVCFSVEEYWNLHADFLCNHWGCGRDDRVVLMNKLYERYPRDHVCSNASETVYSVNLISVLTAQLILQTIPFSHFCQVDGSKYEDMGLVRYGRDVR